MPWIYLGYILKYMKANSKAFILQKYMHNMKITLYVTLTKLPSINKIAFGFLSLTVFPVYYILYKKNMHCSYKTKHFSYICNYY